MRVPNFYRRLSEGAECRAPGRQGLQCSDLLILWRRTFVVVGCSFCCCLEAVQPHISALMTSDRGGLFSCPCFTPTTHKSPTSYDTLSVKSSQETSLVTRAVPLSTGPGAHQSPPGHTVLPRTARHLLPPLTTESPTTHTTDQHHVPMDPRAAELMPIHAARLALTEEGRRG